MSERIFNFSSGPAAMPLPVLERAQREILSIYDSGMSVMEISHRSKIFESILTKAELGIRELLGVPLDYRILFLQGGASLQFSMIPMNFLTNGIAEYVITGSWGKKALAEAAMVGRVNTIFSSEKSGFCSVPVAGEVLVSADATYVHYTSNETIDGVQFGYELRAGTVPVVCDMSSDILSKPLEIENYALIYAGAQKNIGPSGATVVIIRDEMLERVASGLPSVLDYRALALNNSMVNTPNTWAIYMIGLVCDWLGEQGGLAAMEIRNNEKAAVLYEAIDSSDGYYVGHAETSARSVMNVTFRLPTEELEDKFCSEATSNGLDGLRGHRSVGGIRASIYNAFPRAGVDALVDFMKDFALRNG
ncbi:MAG: 3-phosphoserine/phosphohydroxythreonine transaminase [Acidobacteriota bacterium]